MSRQNSFAVEDGYVYWDISIYDIDGTALDADANPTVKYRSHNNDTLKTGGITVTKVAATTGLYKVRFDFSADSDLSVNSSVRIEETATISGTDYVNRWATLIRVSPADKPTLDDIEDVVGDINVATTTIESKTSQLTFTVANQVDANSLTGGTSPSAVADAVWDELLKGSTHNIPTSAGRRLREVAEVGLYEGASVWIDTVNGSSGTSDHENGAVNNPSNNIADATTIANSVGLSRFRIAPASSFTLASGYTGFSFIGDGLWTLVLGGQALVDTMVVNAEVTGTCTSTDEPMFDCCGIGTVTLPACLVRNSRLESDITLSAAGTYHFESCMSAVAGTASPSIDFGAAVGNTNVNFRHYSGGIEVLNMGQSGTDNMSLEGDGALTINANCTGGTIAVRGNFKITDNSGGSVTIVRDDDSSNIVSIKATTDQFVFTVTNQVDANSLTGGTSPSAVAGAVWDSAEASHQAAGSMGKALSDAGATGGSPEDNYSYFTALGRADAFKADLAAIQATTDQFRFTVTNQVDANALSGGTPVGPGGIATPVTILEQGDPVDGAAVWVTTDLAGTNTVAGVLYTDAAGLVTFLLEAGTYYAWAQQSGINFNNPFTLVVTEG